MYIKKSIILLIIKRNFELFFNPNKKEMKTWKNNSDLIQNLKKSQLDYK